MAFGEVSLKDYNTSSVQNIEQYIWEQTRKNVLTNDKLRAMIDRWSADVIDDPEEDLMWINEHGVDILEELIWLRYQYSGCIYNWVEH